MNHGIIFHFVIVLLRNYADIRLLNCVTIYKARVWIISLMNTSHLTRGYTYLHLMYYVINSILKCVKDSRFSTQSLQLYYLNNCMDFEFFVRSCLFLVFKGHEYYSIPAEPCSRRREFNPLYMNSIVVKYCPSHLRLDLTYNAVSK
jgi:hypothetical protein